MPRNDRKRTLWFLCIPVCISLLLSITGVARADRLEILSQRDWRYVWGEVVSLNNGYIDFSIGCSGPVKRFKWEQFALNVVFTNGCSPRQFAQIGGEPVDCSGGRLFRVIDPVTEGYYDFVSYKNGVLTVGIGGARGIIRSVKERESVLTLMCK